MVMNSEQEVTVIIEYALRDKYGKIKQVGDFTPGKGETRKEAYARITAVPVLMKFRWLMRRLVRRLKLLGLKILRRKESE